MLEGDGTSKNLAYGWLLMAVLSLVFAGVFAMLVASARTPGIEDLLPLGRDHIFVALVGHVVLAVVIWFLAFEGFLWIYTTTCVINHRVYSPFAGWVSIGLCSIGVALVVVSAVFGLGSAELANYVPVLLTPYFYAGLIFFAAGILINLVNMFLTVARAKAQGATLPTVTFGMVTAGVAVFAAFSCFALSGYYQVATGKAFFDFERLFWGGGHILQFANTIAMVTVWMYLAYLIYGKEPIGSGKAKLLYAFYLLFIIPAPFLYFIYDTADSGYKDAFTFLMRWGLGPSTSVLALSVVYLLLTGDRVSFKKPGFSSLVLSMLIFLTGGVLALMIKGVNTIIPAHYHCVIGAVTIAFMGLFYEILPAFKREIYSKKMAAVQPYLYFAGILLFAVGLYIAGSHGVARKTYGGAQNLNSMGKFVGMAIMGLGGVVSILGGITFVVNAIATLLKKENATVAVYDSEMAPLGKH